jgi:hypothetical protein
MTWLSDDWFVPGGAYITDSTKMRLRPPGHWTKVELEIPRVPQSMNNNEIRTNWRGFHTVKKSWQEEMELLLMAQRVKRDGYKRAIAGAFVRFPRAGKRRDTNNFTTLLNKALGDALARSSYGGYGAIPDDDERRYFFGGVEFEDPGPARTLIWIYLQPKEG